MDLVNIILSILLGFNATCTLIIWLKYCKLHELVNVIGNYLAHNILIEKLEDLKDVKKSN